MNILSLYGQKQIVEQLRKLSPESQQFLLSQLAEINLDTIERQRALLHQPQHNMRDVTPLHSFATSGNEMNRVRGGEAIAAGEIACLILAGGQGTRLGFPGPKGMFPISPVKNKSLFQIFAEKTAAASRMANRRLCLAIMTSPLNHDETVEFFKTHDFFGLVPDQVSFFSQHMLPFLDTDGNFFLSSPDNFAQGPDGNGDALHNLVRSGIWKQWLTHGVRFVNVVLVDNPLADPFDAELVGYAIEQHADVIIKSTMRTDEKENVGVIAQEKGKIVVVEYSEMPTAHYTSRNKEGDLNFNCSNLSLFCLGMDFIKSIAQKANLLPLHKAFKATPFVDAHGKVVNPTTPNAWKFERFIFDILPFSTKTSVLVYPREECFAPLKNSTGLHSPATVKLALEARDRQILKKIYSIDAKESPLEIPQELYYPTPETFAKWTKRSHA